MLSKRFVFLALWAFSAPAFGAEPRQKYRLGDVPVDDPVTRKDENTIPPDGIRDAKAVDPVTPEDNARLVNEVAEEFYQKGLKAMNAGRYEQAEGFFDRVLILKPGHPGARAGVNKLMKIYEADSAPTREKGVQRELLIKLESRLDRALQQNRPEEALRIANEILAVDPGNRKAKTKLPGLRNTLHTRALERGKEREAAGDVQGALDAYQIAVSYEKSDALAVKITSLLQKASRQKHEQSNKLYLEALKISQQGESESAISLCRQALALDPNNLQAQRMLDRLQGKIRRR